MSNAKPYSCAIVACSLLPMLLIMKTETSLPVPNKVRAYVELQQQVHEALLREHPEWVDPDGTCLTCDIYESRLAKLLGVPSLSEHRAA